MRCGIIASPIPSSPPGLNLTYTFTCSGGNTAAGSSAGGSRRSVCMNTSRADVSASAGEEGARMGSAKPKSVSRERDLRGVLRHVGTGGGRMVKKCESENTLWSRSLLSACGMPMPAGVVGAVMEVMRRDGRQCKHELTGGSKHLMVTLLTCSMRARAAKSSHKRKTCKEGGAC